MLWGAWGMAFHACSLFSALFEKFQYSKCCCCNSVPKSCLTLCDPMDWSMPGFPVLHCLPEFAHIHVHWAHWCHPTISSSVAPFSSCLPSIFPSIRVFSSKSAFRIRWPKYWSLSISPSNEYSGLISFRIDCFDLLAVQGTPKSLLQYHNLKASILWHSAFFTIQLSSVRGYWKNHSFGYMDFCQQSDVFAS